MPAWMLLLTQFSIIAFAMLGGVFLAFSDFIMRALRATGGAGGPEAMQAINREVLRYVFVPLLLAMAPISLALAIGAATTAAEPALFIGAAAIYLVGAFGVTIARNVPMNNALAALDPGSAEGLDYWRSSYLPRWTFWNSVRTVACLASSVLLLVAVADA